MKENQNNIDEQIKKFKNDLLTEDKFSLNDIINKYIIFGNPYVFEGQEEAYYQLKKRIAEFLNVNQRDIFVAGSGKLGFSLSPQKLWQKFDGNPEKDSDIDVVVISKNAFDKYWQAIFDFRNNQIKSKIRNEKDVEFLEYFFRGWLRPDKFPDKYKGADEWFEFCREVSYKDKYGKRKIAVAIYREDYHFLSYHEKTLKYIKKILKNEV